MELLLSIDLQEIFRLHFQAAILNLSDHKNQRLLYTGKDGRYLENKDFLPYYFVMCPSTMLNVRLPKSPSAQFCFYLNHTFLHCRIKKKPPCYSLARLQEIPPALQNDNQSKLLPFHCLELQQW